MKLRIAPRDPAGALDGLSAGPMVKPVLAGRRLPGFDARPGEAGRFADGWRVTLGPDAEAAGALAAARLHGERRLRLDLRGLDPAVAVAFITGVHQRAWRFDRLKTVKESARLARLDVLTDAPGPLRRAWRQQAPALAACDFARTLVAEPANILTPRAFCQRLDRLRRAGVAVEILKGAALRRAGLGGLLAVGGGSAQAPRLAVLRWPGAFDAPPVVFVGKGLTFDTGGVCIKPAAGMEEMRADMAGAAAAAGAMLALALRRSPAPAAAVLPLAENMTGATSYRPSDVLTLFDGSTCEIVDTDAEGRLVLADALAWAVRHLRPAAIVDLATLTGSIVAALGGEMAGLFDNDPAFAAHVAAAGQAIGEPVWRMPIGATHREDLRSAIADIRHCVPGRFQPDACHAAAFLREFVGAVPWVHLDIAGMELRAKADDRHAAGATGFGVRLLDRLVAQRFEGPAQAVSEIGFYHLTRSTAEQALPKLLGRTLAAGQRAVVLLGGADRLKAISDALWASNDPDWLPHGSAATGEAEWQPIWLTTAAEAPNGARFLFRLDGTEADPAAFDRVFDLFDGGDDDAVAAARLRWTTARSAGHVLTYWQQGERGWQKRA